MFFSAACLTSAYINVGTCFLLNKCKEIEPIREAKMFAPVRSVFSSLILKVSTLCHYQGFFYHPFLRKLQTLAVSLNAL